MAGLELTNGGTVTVRLADRQNKVDMPSETIMISHVGTGSQTASFTSSNSYNATVRHDVEPGDLLFVVGSARPESDTNVEKMINNIVSPLEWTTIGHNIRIGAGTMSVWFRVAEEGDAGKSIQIHYPQTWASDGSTDRTRAISFNSVLRPAKPLDELHSSSIDYRRTDSGVIMPGSTPVIGNAADIYIILTQGIPDPGDPPHISPADAIRLYGINSSPRAIERAIEQGTNVAWNVTGDGRWYGWRITVRGPF